jgi:hypothetical protein
LKVDAASPQEIELSLPRDQSRKGNELFDPEPSHGLFDLRESVIPLSRDHEPRLRKRGDECRDCLDDFDGALPPDVSPLHPEDRKHDVLSGRVVRAVELRVDPQRYASRFSNSQTWRDKLDFPVRQKDIEIRRTQRCTDQRALPPGPCRELLVLQHSGHDYRLSQDPGQDERLKCPRPPPHVIEIDVERELRPAGRRDDFVAQGLQDLDVLPVELPGLENFL